MAPEIISLEANPEFRGKAQYQKYVKKGGTYNHLVDIWALGCMVYFMIVGESPFDK